MLPYLEFIYYCSKASQLALHCPSIYKLRCSLIFLWFMNCVMYWSVLWNSARPTFLAICVTTRTHTHARPCKCVCVPYFLHTRFATLGICGTTIRNLGFHYTIYTCNIRIRTVIAQLEERWATGRTIGVLGFDSRLGVGIFLFTTASRTALEPNQPPIKWVLGALSLEVRRPGREAEHTSI
jgi:hypothetical protein